VTEEADNGRFLSHFSS